MNADKLQAFSIFGQNVLIITLCYSMIFTKKGLYKYDQEIYDLYMDSFDMMPLACIINGKFLALHGGISPEMKSVKN